MVTEFIEISLAENFDNNINIFVQYFNIELKEYFVSKFMNKFISMYLDIYSILLEGMKEL